MRFSDTITALVIIFVLNGCGPRETKSEITGPPAKIEGIQSCMHTSFCVSCLPGFDGKLTCGAKLSPYCPGSQSVLYLDTPVKRHYEDGTTRNDISRQILSTGKCS